MLIGICLEFEDKGIIFSLNSFKFGIHLEDDHVKLLDFGVCVNPSEMGLLFLILWKLTIILLFRR